MGETRFYRIHEAPVVFLIKILTLLLFSDILLFVIDIVFDLSSLEGRFSSVLSLTEELFFIVMFFQLIFLTYLFLEWMFHYYWFENGVLHQKRGIIWVHYDEFIMKEIEATNVSQSFVGRVLNYGSISIISHHQKTILRRIPRPNEFSKLLVIEKQNQAQPSK